MQFSLVSGQNMGGEDSPIYSPVSADVEPFSNDADNDGDSDDSDDYDDVVSYSQAQLMWTGPTDRVASFFLIHSKLAS